MRTMTTLLATTLCLSACAVKGTHSDDPYETMNRKTYQFNRAFDATFLKPVAKVYKAILPAPVRTGVNNVYDNVYMIPTVANDLLQAEWHHAFKDTWRLVVNSTMGIGGILDVASTMSLPPHYNDLGITFAKWGDKHSPYFIIPFLGPSTFRDGMGLMFDYALFTPYPYFNINLTYGLLGVRYIDLRSQMLDTDKLMVDALDSYTFMRDAYLQHRHYLITGEQSQEADSSALYIEGEDGKSPGQPEMDFPLTTAAHHDVTHRTTSA